MMRAPRLRAAHSRHQRPNFTIWACGVLTGCARMLNEYIIGPAWPACRMRKRVLLILPVRTANNGVPKRRLGTRKVPPQSWRNLFPAENAPRTMTPDTEPTTHDAKRGLPATATSKNLRQTALLETPRRGGRAGLWTAASCWRRDVGKGMRLIPAGWANGPYSYNTWTLL